MTEDIVENHAEDVPFSHVIADLLSSNLRQRPEKMKVFQGMFGKVAIHLPDIDAAVTLIFLRGSLKIEKGVAENPDLIIRSSSEKIISLNAISVKFGMPYYFDGAGMSVLRQLVKGDLKIRGMFAHPLLLTRLTKIMSVM